MPDTPESLISRGYEARRGGLTKEAKQFFSGAVELCNATDDALRARALTGLGQIERDLKNFPLALEHYLHAAKIYRSTSDPLRLAHTIRHVGDILRKHGGLEDAKPCYEEAVALYRQHSESSKLDVANALRGFALLSEDLGDITRAKSLWQDARHLYEAVHVQAGIEESDEHLRHLLESND
jgi:tetratricopeptide (TPR) repeat protein